MPRPGSRKEQSKVASDLALKKKQDSELLLLAAPGIIYFNNYLLKL